MAETAEKLRERVKDRSRELRQIDWERRCAWYERIQRAVQVPTLIVMIGLVWAIADDAVPRNFWTMGGLVLALVLNLLAQSWSSPRFKPESEFEAEAAQQIDFELMREQGIPLQVTD